MATNKKRSWNVSEKAYSGISVTGSARKIKSANIAYRYFYYIGAQVIRRTKRIKRKIFKFLTPVKDFFIMLFQKGIANRITRMSNEFRAVKKDFGRAAKRMRIARELGAKDILLEPLRIFTDGLRKHKSFVSKIFNVAAPALAIVLLLFTVNYYITRNYALEVNYGENKVGFVANEEVYTQAVEMISERIVGNVTSVNLDKEPTFKLTVVEEDALLEPREVCDTVLGLTDGEIEEAYGLVVNGDLIGAIKSEGDMQFILDDFLNDYKTDANMERVEFIDDIQVEHGYYPLDAIVDSDELKKEITTTHPTIDYYTIKSGDSPIRIADKTDMSLEKLQELNPDINEVMYPGARLKVERDKPVLGVQSVDYSTYYKTLAFSTKTVKDSSQYKDYKSLKTAGKKGRERYVEEVTYIDGEEVSRKLVERVVESEPVDAVYVVGTKERPRVVTPPKNNNSGKNSNSSSKPQGGSSVGKGNFAWPVPGVRSISSPYGMRWGRMHSGVDISTSGIRGRTIVAAGGGTVTKVANDSNGYGRYCVITHSGGYSTLYAHCQSLSVSKGQTVSKGQAIGKVGNTGRSTGPHLHFEIRYNGSAKNPMSYY